MAVLDWLKRKIRGQKALTPMNSNTYIPPELRRIIHNKANSKTKYRLQLANRHVANLADYTKGTGRYQKVWNELPKKLHNVYELVEQLVIPYDDKLEILRIAIANMQRIYRKDRSELSRRFRELQYFFPNKSFRQRTEENINFKQMLALLGLPVAGVPTDPNTIVDVILRRADAVLRARRPPELDAMNTRIIRHRRILRQITRWRPERVSDEVRRQRRLNRRAARR